jgi:hypothetical protein
MRFAKIVAGLAGAIVLGAVGSGVWDLFLKPVVLWLWRWSASITGMAVSSVRNVPYHDAATASPHDTMLYLLVMLACGWLGTEMAKFDSPWKVPANATPEEKAAIYRRWRRVARPLTFAIFFFFSFQIGQARLTYQIADDLQHNIATIAPFVEAKEAAALRYASSQ